MPKMELLMERMGRTQRAMCRRLAQGLKVVFHLDFQKFAQIVEFAGNRLLLETILQLMNVPLAGTGRPLWLWTRGGT